MSNGILICETPGKVAPVAFGSPAWRRFTLGFEMRNLQGILGVQISRYNDLEDFENGYLWGSDSVIHGREVRSPEWIPCRVEVGVNEVIVKYQGKERAYPFRTWENDRIIPSGAFRIRGVGGKPARVELRNLRVWVQDRMKGY
jgi:hypothetical protein